LQNRGNDRGANGQTCLPIVAQREQRDAQQGALPLTSVGSCNMSPSIAARTVAASLEGDQGNNPDVNMWSPGKVTILSSDTQANQSRLNIRGRIRLPFKMESMQICAFFWRRISPAPALASDPWHGVMPKWWWRRAIGCAMSGAEVS